LAISVDVEEEGLFCGRYSRQPAGVRNVGALDRLEFVTREFGLPLTLLATHAVLADAAGAARLQDWRDRRGAELGVHLHHWNTPPLAATEPVSPDAAQVPPALLREKLATLCRAFESVAGAPPRVFRMGRFDLAPPLPEWLAAAGFAVDSSVVPLNVPSAAANHFMAGADPFRLPAGILEAPLTVVSPWPGMSRGIYRCAGGGRTAAGRALLRAWRHVGAVGIQPAWYGPAALRRAARLHRERGGTVLNLFLHSSELQPGATPRYPDEAAVGRLLGRLRDFLEWLRQTLPVTGVTLSGVATEGA